MVRLSTTNNLLLTNNTGPVMAACSYIFLFNYLLIFVNVILTCCDSHVVVG